MADLTIDDIKSLGAKIPPKNAVSANNSQSDISIDEDYIKQLGANIPFKPRNTDKFDRYINTTKDNTSKGLLNDFVEKPGYIEPKKQPSLIDKLIGAGETALNVGTQATTGALGLIGGGLAGATNLALSSLDPTSNITKQQAIDAITKPALQLSEAFTYKPKTELGQDYSDKAQFEIGRLPPAIFPELLTSQATPQARNIAQYGLALAKDEPIVEKISQLGSKITSETAQKASKVKEAFNKSNSDLGDSVGAMKTPQEQIRNYYANDLPVPIELTKGQLTRNIADQSFERETAKLDAGNKLNDRFVEQNKQVLQNLDAFEDITGNTQTSSRGVGLLVDKALNDKANAKLSKISQEYKKAEQAGETLEPLNTQKLTDFLNDNINSEGLASILPATKGQLVKLKGATKNEAGELIAKDLTINNLEKLRQYVNQNNNFEGSNKKFGRDLISTIDNITDEANGSIYKNARSLRRDFANEFENIKLIDDLLSTRSKKYSGDRKIALEDITKKIVYDGSLDDFRNARRTIQTAPNGLQAWKEVQAQVLRDLKDNITKSTNANSAGDIEVSASKFKNFITDLDKEGKLDFLYGKQGAEQLRKLNELVQVIYTSPKGAVNHSNTASTLLKLVSDMGVSQLTAGIPLPLLALAKASVTGIKNTKTRQKIREALNYSKKLNKGK